MDFAAAYAGKAPAWVDFSAIVTSPPRFFYGSRTHAMHEAFDVQSAAGRVEIVDNVSIAPRCPVRSGDNIEVRGEMVHDPGANCRSCIGRITIPDTITPTASSVFAGNCTHSRMRLHTKQLRNRDEPVAFAF